MGFKKNDLCYFEKYNCFAFFYHFRNIIEGKTRMSAFEYVSVFLQLHAIVHLNIGKNNTFDI